jgi:hypothetical protein
MSSQDPSLTKNAALIATWQAQVVLKAEEDATFRAALLANPKAAIEKTVGAKIADQIKINVIESAANTVTIALPYAAKVGAGGELSDSDLESVAGGSKSGFKAFGDGFVEGFTDTMKIGLPIIKAIV